MGYMKKALNIVLSSILCASLIITPVFATPTEDTINKETANKENIEETPDENGHYSVEYTHDIVPDTNKLPAWPQGPLINSESAILMDMDTGEILYAKSPYKEQYPASITKLLTVLVALDYIQPDDTVEISQASIDFLKAGDAHIAMQPGEIISMEDALYAVLFASANEVSYAVAENVGKKYLDGGYDEFIQKMNEKSKEIGCKNSHWVNANGLHNEEHYTSAYDMALIGAEIYKNPVFNEMMEGFEHVIPPTNLVDEQRVFQQHHKMTWTNGIYYYENCNGGKTGYTDNAQTTLVTLADDGERKFVAVLLYDRGGEAYVQTRALFDYGYDNFSKVLPANVDFNDDIKEFTDPEKGLSLPKGIEFEKLESSLYADADKEDMGTVTYTYNKNPMGKFEVKLEHGAYNKLIKAENSIPEIEDEDHAKSDIDISDPMKTAVKVAVVVVIALILLVIIVFFIRLNIHRKRKRLKRIRDKKRRQAKQKNRKKNVRR